MYPIVQIATAETAVAETAVADVAALIQTQQAYNAVNLVGMGLIVGALLVLLIRR